MADNRFISKFNLPYMNKYIAFLTIDNQEQYQLIEITDATAYAPSARINSNQDKEIYTLYSSPENKIQLSTPTIKEKDKAVRKMRLHVFLINEEEMCFLVELTFSNKEKKIFTFNVVEDCQKLFAKMQSRGVYEYKFSKTINPYDWEHNDLEKHYNSKIHENYSRYFKTAAQTIKPLLLQHNNHEVHFILPACGTAKYLDYLQKELGKEFNLHFWGFDINQINIKKAKEKIREGYFEVSTLAEMETFIQKINQNINQSDCKVFLFSGVLARTIAEDKKSAIKYLQYAIRSADFVILASHTDSYIDSYIAKACGLKKERLVPVLINYVDGIKSSTDKIHHSVDFYKKSIEEERVSFLLERFEKRKRQGSASYTIDLSFSANPLQDLKWLEKYAPQKLAEATHLDLSWCYIKKEEMSELAEMIKSIPLKMIIVSESDLSWAQSLQKSTGIKFGTRLDSPNLQTPPHGSIPSLRRLGLMGDLNCKILKQEESKNKVSDLKVTRPKT